jgi:hypothetical protein
VLFRSWVGGCALYDVDKLRRAGGYSFWRQLPRQHCGEDVLAQLRVMAQFGGCGLIPSGAFHQELPSTVPDSDRQADAPLLLHERAPERGGEAQLQSASRLGRAGGGAR